MKVLFFSDTYLPEISGITRTLGKLLAYLDKKKIEHIILAPQCKNGDMYSNVERFLSVPFLLYPERRLSLPNHFRINQIINEFKPDLVHLVTEFSMGVAGLKAAKKRNLPVVSSYHTNYHDYLKSSNLAILEKPCWTYVRWFHNQTQKTLCPSNATKKLLIDHGFTDVGVWSRGVDCDLFSPEKRKNELKKELGLDGKIVLHFASRIGVEKGVDVLLKTVAKLNDKYKDKITLLVTGEGPYLAEAKKNAPENTVFVGYKRGEELANMYALGDIFVFPSTFETFGNVVTESMASGVPVVGANVGGVTDIIRTGYNGILCKPNDVDDFARAVATLIENTDIRNKFSKNSRDYAVTRSWDNIFGELMNDYQNAIDERKDKKIFTA